MLVNARNSWWRRALHREVSVPSVGDLPTGVDHGGAAADRDALWRLVRALPDRQRAVLVLRYFDDLTEVRTAEILGVTVGTVKSQTSVALRRLRELAPELAETVRIGQEG